MQPEAIDEVLAEVDWLQRLARRLAVDVHSADDLVQQTFVVALQGSNRPDGNLRGWLAAIVHNLARTDRRSRVRRRVREAQVARTEAIPFSNEVPIHDDDLVRAVRALSEPYRSAIVLRYLEGEAPGAIAVRTGVPATLVRNHISRGLSKLRERLVKG